MSSANVQDGARLDIVMNGFGGEGQNMYLLMFAFSIHLLHPMLPVLCLRAIGSMKTSRRELMDNRFERLIMVHLPLWSCLPLEDWLMRPLTFLNVRLPFWLVSGGDECSVVMGWL